MALCSSLNLLLECPYSVIMCLNLSRKWSFLFLHFEWIWLLLEWPKRRRTIFNWNGIIEISCAHESMLEVLLKIWLLWCSLWSHLLGRRGNWKILNPIQHSWWLTNSFFSVIMDVKFYDLLHTFGYAFGIIWFVWLRCTVKLCHFSDFSLKLLFNFTVLRKNCR